MLIAFTSYIFTWQVDYDKVSGSVVSVLSPSVKTENWLGNFGAMISNLFIGHWFGIASFGFVLLFFIWGIRLLTGLTLLPLKKTLRISIFIILWTSVTLGFMFHTSHLFLGGGIGYFTSGWLENFSGKAGTIALIAFTGLTFLIINNLVRIPDLRTKLPSNEEPETKEDQTEIEEEIEKKPESPTERA